MFAMQGGVATSPQILTHLSRRTAQRQLRDGHLVKIWPGIYSLGEPDTRRRLHGLDLLCGETAVVCLGTAAGAYGFDTRASAICTSFTRSAADCVTSTGWWCTAATAHP